MNSKTCNVCNKRPATVNYVRNGMTYYRKACYHCIKKKKDNQGQQSQLLKKSGYKKKTVCDRCGFIGKTSEQMSVHYKDGNSYNVSINNLRTYCSNCAIEVNVNPLADKRDILPDF
jgi:hypothetical protein